MTWYSRTTRLSCILKASGSQNPQNPRTWRSELVPWPFEENYVESTMSLVITSLADLLPTVRPAVMKWKSTVLELQVKPLPASICFWVLPFWSYRAHWCWQLQGHTTHDVVAFAAIFPVQIGAPTNPGILTRAKGIERFEWSKCGWQMLGIECPVSTFCQTWPLEKWLAFTFTSLYNMWNVCLAFSL